MHYGRSMPVDQKLCRNAAGVTQYNSLCENSPHRAYSHLHSAVSNENVKRYFRDTSYNGRRTVWCHPERLCLSSRRGFASLQSTLSFQFNYVFPTFPSRFQTQPPGSIFRIFFGLHNTPLPSHPFHSPPLRSRPVKSSYGVLGNFGFWCILALKSDIWWQQF